MKISLLQAKEFLFRINQRAKFLFVRALSVVPFAAKALGIPSKRVTSTKEWVSRMRLGADWSVRNNQPCYFNLTPAGMEGPRNAKKLVETTQPKSRTAVPAKRFNYWDARSGFDSRRGFQSTSFELIPESFVAYLPHGKVVGPTGSVISREGHFFMESIWTWENWESSERALNSLSLPPPEQLEGVSYTVASIYQSGYPHWLLETLPRLAGVRLLPENVQPNLIFSSGLATWQTESLKLLGLGDLDTLALNDRILQCEHLFFPSYVGLPGSPHPIVMNWVRQSLLSAVESSNVGRRLYITRRLCDKRRVVNEEQLYPMLEEHGFEVVEAENLSFSSQIELFNNATYVIAPHGAGLANLLFAHENCRVLELLDRDYVNDHYFNLSALLGLSYNYLLCDSVAKLGGERLQTGRDHILVKEEEFRVAINELTSDNR